LHDLHRRTRRGAGTFDAAMRGVQLLREGRVPFHVICVLTRRSLSRADELFAFFRELEVDWIGFNFDEAEGEHTASSMAYPDCAAEVRGFFDRFLTLNAEAGHPISVREFEGVVQGILTVDAPDPTNQQADPFRIISVDVDGNISTFSPELLGFSHPRYGTFSFGNIWTDTIEDIRRSPRYQAVAGDIARGVTSCRETCDYYSVCLGGAPANKLFENGCFDTTETLYCRLSKQAPVDVVLASLERAFRPSAARRAMAEV
jgi:uncharacterized protein